eukprot:gene1007-1978_t
MIRIDSLVQSIDGSVGSNSSDLLSCTSDEYIPSDSDDYGFFDIDIDEHEENMINWSHKSAQTSPNSFISIDSRLDFDSKGNSNIIFTFNIKSSPMSCRSFGSFDCLPNNIQVSSSVTGFRIVQDASGEHPEFRVMLCVGIMKYVVWRKHSDFNALIKAVTFVSPMQSYVKNSMLIWKDISRRRRWRISLSVQYLTWKAMKLGDFLREFLFEIPIPSILEAFVRDE